MHKPLLSLQFRSPNETTEATKHMIPCSKSVVFTKPGTAEFREVPTLPLKPGETLIQTKFSIVSPGTELACLKGTEWWAPMPFTPGYGSVGRIVETDDEAYGPRKGQRILTYGAHSQYATTQTLIIPLSDTIDPAKATFARMGSISMTSLRVSDAALGDFVAVAGLGLVGNLAAQFFTLAGCEVIGVDLSERRRELARECGIRHVLPPGDELKEAVASLTGGEMCRTVVEATGVPAVALNAGALAGKRGELILLGSPRGEFIADLTPFLNRTHLWDEGCITIKGAHEWIYPNHQDGQGHGRHSIERNARCILRFIETGKLHIDPLLSHCVSPAECQAVYDGLKNQKDDYIGVVYDWSSV